MYSQLAKQSSPRNSIDSPARIVVIKILILDCSFAISRPKDKIIQYAKKQRGMIPFFSFVGLFLLLSEIFTLWKIIYITLQLSTDHYGRLPLCKSWEHPLLSIPHLVSSPSPPPPSHLLPTAPNLLEKGCGQQEGINGIGKQTAEEKLDADNVGTEALQSSSFTLMSRPSQLSYSNDVIIIWVVFEDRFPERRIQLQWKRNTSTTWHISGMVMKVWWTMVACELGYKSVKAHWVERSKCAEWGAENWLKYWIRLRQLVAKWMREEVGGHIMGWDWSNGAIWKFALHANVFHSLLMGRVTCKSQCSSNNAAIFPLYCQLLMLTVEFGLIVTCSGQIHGSVWFCIFFIGFLQNIKHIIFPGFSIWIFLF